MNVSTVSTSTSTATLNNKTYKIEMIEDGHMSAQSDDDDDPPSSPASGYCDGQDIMQMAMEDEVTSQLAAAGPVGVAAAAAIASAKKRKKPHSFETNPSIRKRQQNRLLRKLRQIIYEFTGRVGQQAIVLVATPGKPNTSYKVFGAKPLEDVVRNLKSIVMEELETALAQQAPPPPQEDPSLFELPPLIIDGIPTPVEKMTQAQLRAFIPLMLKYSTGRGKPGWGRESTRPPWWPKELPWANVRMDARTEEEKQKISWTHALRKIVINCYRYHGREDLLPTFSDDDEKVTQIVNNAANNSQTNQQQINNNVGVLKLHNSGTTTIQVANNTSPTTTAVAATNTGTTSKIEIQTAQNAAAQTIANAQYTQTVLSTIQNGDGTLSLIQVDPNNPIITLPDGTTAQVQGVATLHTTAQGETVQTVQSLADAANGHTENMTVDLTEATLAQDGQIIITGEDGQGYPVSVSSMITVPVSASMYQTMVANIQQLHPNGDGTVCITPMQVENNNHNFQQQLQTTTTSSSSPSSSSSSSLTALNNYNQTQQTQTTTTNNNNIATIMQGAVVNGKVFRAILQTNNNNNNNNNNNRQLRCHQINNNNSSQITQISSSHQQSKILLNNNNNNQCHNNNNLFYQNSPITITPQTQTIKSHKKRKQQLISTITPIQTSSAPSLPSSTTITTLPSICLKEESISSCSSTNSLSLNSCIPNKTPKLEQISSPSSSPLKPPPPSTSTLTLNISSSLSSSIQRSDENSHLQQHHIVEIKHQINDDNDGGEDNRNDDIELKLPSTKIKIENDKFSPKKENNT